MISVIIPVYNAEKYLAEALDSVLAQTYTDYECVCVNDGSTDGSAKILSQYEAKFRQTGRRFRIVNKENGGEGSARNAGMDVAQGEYITWLDADDVMAPTRFEVAVRIIENENPDLVRLHYTMGREKPVKFTPEPVYAYTTLTDPVGIFEWGWKELNEEGMVWLWFARRDLLIGMRFRPEMRVKTDCEFSSALIPRIRKLCYCQDRGLYYRVLDTSMFQSERKGIDCIHCQLAFLDLWKAQRLYADRIGRLEFLRRRIKKCAQSDLLDWIRMKPKNEEIDVRSRVREAYLKMLKSGAFSEKWVLNNRYRLPLSLYERTGWIWAVEIVEQLLTAYRFVGKVIKG